jgi:hypothetical protein
MWCGVCRLRHAVSASIAAGRGWRHHDGRGSISQAECNSDRADHPGTCFGREQSAVGERGGSKPGRGAWVRALREVLAELVSEAVLAAASARSDAELPE